MPNLVAIHNNSYSFYNGKSRVVSVNSDTPIDSADIESYRLNPEELKSRLTENYYAPQEYRLKAIHNIMLFDGSEECINNLYVIFKSEIAESLSKLSGIFYISITLDGYKTYSKQEFEELFEVA